MRRKMRAIRGRCTWWVCFFLAVMAAQSSCSRLGGLRNVTDTQAEKTPHMCIVSNLGEVFREACYVGESIVYRITYANKAVGRKPFNIVVQLDEGLKFVSVKGDGVYDPEKHTVNWKMNSSLLRRIQSVEFKGRAADVGPLVHYATLSTDRGEVRTNKVENIVCENPKLGWIPLVATAMEGARPKAYIKDESTTGILVNFDLPGIYVNEDDSQGRKWHRLFVSGYSHLPEIGAPELPVLGQIVEVPFGVNLSVGIEQAEFVPMDCYHVWPSQKPSIWSPEAEAPAFELNAARYTGDGLYPGQLSAVTAEDIGVVRGHRLVMLRAFPIQYNPVTREMQAYKKMEVRLKYNRPAQIQPAPGRLLSEPFEEFFEASVLNYKDNDRFTWGTAGSEDKTGAEYLILAHGDFINPPGQDDPLEDFRIWKQRKGWLTRVVDVANIPGGASDANIEAYLRNAYTTWDPAPSYVLLVGDDDLIPTCHRTSHPLSHGNSKIGTDLYYAAVDGNDYFPDIFMGRLPVASVAELDGVVDKLVGYEQNPPASTNFYNDLPLVMLFEDDPLLGGLGGDPSPEDGREDDGFGIIERAEALRVYLAGEGYNVERIYNQSGVWPGPGGGPGPREYEDGGRLPNDLIGAADAAAGILGFPWNGGRGDIQTAINNGTFLAVYAGHGGPQQWSLPHFRVGDVGGLANAGEPPVVFSWACQTGWFDDTTDDATHGIGTGDESLCETFVTTDLNGAVAAIGASRDSWDINLSLMDGAARALWPDFRPEPGISRLLRLGQVLNYSKMYMASLESDAQGRRVHFELYHLFGDPEMPVWTTEPGQLTVDHPSGIGSAGIQEFIVKVGDRSSRSPVTNATVTLTREGQIVDMHQTDPAGIVRFLLNSPASGQLDVTVTGYDYRPYLGTMEISPGGAQLNRMDPLHGPEGQDILVGGQSFSADSEVQILFGSAAAATISSSAAGSFGQAGEEDVSILVPRPYPLGPVNVTARDSADRHAARIFQVRGANEIDLYTYDQYDSSTWHLFSGDNPTWNNPEIRLLNSSGNPVESDNLTEGREYTVEVKIHNDTEFDADQVRVTFKWANYGLGQPFELIGPNPTVFVDVPKIDSAFARITWIPQATGHICIQAEIYHVEDINPGNNLAQENCHVGTSNSPYDIPFQVCNPTRQAAAMFLELRQLFPGTDPEHVPWATWLTHPHPQVLPPGECREATAHVDPDPAKVKSGDIAEFALTGFAGRQMIGGVNFIVKKR